MLIFVSKPPRFLFFWKCFSFKIDFVKLALKGVLCTRLGSKGPVIYDFVPLSTWRPPLPRRYGCAHSLGTSQAVGWYACYLLTVCLIRNYESVTSFKWDWACDQLKINNVWAENLKNTSPQWDEPAIQSCYKGQRISHNDNCQLTITWSTSIVYALNSKCDISHPLTWTGASMHGRFCQNRNFFWKCSKFYCPWCSWQHLGYYNSCINTSTIVDTINFKLAMVL